MFYIIRKDHQNLETVDEFSDRKEAEEMLAEYRLSDRSATYFIDTKTRLWNSQS